MVLTDLPGVQRPRDELTRRMQRRVEQELGEADAALFVVSADQGVGGGGTAASPRRSRPRRCRSCSPSTRSTGRTTRGRSWRWRGGGPGRGRRGVPRLGADRARRARARRPPGHAAPRGPVLLPAREVSDQPESVLLAELVREQVLARTRQEVPHSVEVQVEEIEHRGD